MNATVRLLDMPFDPAGELGAFTSDAAAGAGGVVSFTGMTRSIARDGGPVSVLVLESYRSATLRSMEAISAAAHERFDLLASVVLHRQGRILAGEAIVFVATAATHRRAAFEAADYLMDRLKSEAVFWKREEGFDGGRWIEPTEADMADLARWNRPTQD